MITLARIELRKLTTTPALYVSAGIVALFTVLSVAAGIMLAGQQGTPPLGSEPNVTKTLSIAALSSMVMLVLGILATAGEFRHRTIMWTVLAEPRRGRVLAYLAGCFRVVQGEAATRDASASIRRRSPQRHCYSK